MKRIGTLLALMLTVAAVAAPLKFLTISKVTVAENVPVQLTSTGTEVYAITFLGKKAARTNNTGTVWIQFANSTNAVGLPITPGQSLTIDGGTPFEPIVLSDIWIESETAADGVQAIYIMR